jgi:hypothetical protein
MDVPVVAAEPTPEERAVYEAERQRRSDAMIKLRMERDVRINTTDKYVTLDYPIDDETRAKWSYYRQHLRDLPAMSSPELDENGELTGVEWPVPPNAQEV